MQSESITSTKTCRVCHESKPLEQFDRNTRTAGGRRNDCKACRKLYAAQNSTQIAAYQRQWREQNRERVAEYGRRQRSDQREMLRERRRGYYFKDVDRTRALRREYRTAGGYAARWRAVRSAEIAIYRRRHYVAHAERLRSAYKRWQQANPDQTRMRVLLRRARRVAAEGQFTQAEWADLCAKYGNQCLACGRNDRPLTVDHIVPLSQGGTNWITNVQPLCKPCNQMKFTKIIDYRPAE